MYPTYPYIQASFYMSPAVCSSFVVRTLIWQWSWCFSLSSRFLELRRRCCTVAVNFRLSILTHSTACLQWPQRSAGNICLIAQYCRVPSFCLSIFQFEGLQPHVQTQMSSHMLKYEKSSISSTNPMHIQLLELQGFELTHEIWHVRKWLCNHSIV